MDDDLIKLIKYDIYINFKDIDIFEINIYEYDINNIIIIIDFKCIYKIDIDLFKKIMKNYFNNYKVGFKIPKFIHRNYEYPYRNICTIEFNLTKKFYARLINGFLGINSTISIQCCS